MDEEADWVLAERLRAGDDAAFDALMARYKRPILDFVYRMIGDATEAEDVAQDVFVRAYDGLRRPGFKRTSARLSTWLFQVARNAALDRLRWRRRHPASSLAAEEGGGRSVRASGGDASEQAAAHEAGRAIADAVAALPEDQRAAVVMAEFEGASADDIAAVMHCSRKAVEARLYRARQFLRRRLAHLLDA